MAQLAAVIGRNRYRGLDTLEYRPPRMPYNRVLPRAGAFANYRQ